MERLNALIDWLKPRLAHAFWFTLALVFLIESWLWDHVKEWLRQLERFLGIERLEPWLEGLVKRLSPQKTLMLFAVPMLALLPFKVAAVELLSAGHIFWGVAVILLLKTLALGVEAFLFDICREKLLEMPWFARFYSIVLDVRAWASMLVRPYKERVLAFARDARDYAMSFIGKDGGEFARQIARLRQFVKQSRPG